MKKSLILLPLIFLPFSLTAQNYFAPLGGPIGVSVHSSYKDANGMLYIKTNSTIKHQKSFDDGGTWMPVMINDSTQIERLYSDEMSNLYAIDNSGVLFKSDENGSVWDTLFVPGFPSNINTLSISPSGNLYYHSYPDLYLSTNKGILWSLESTQAKALYEIEFHPNGDMYAIFLSNKTYIAKSVTGGVTWEEVFESPISPFSFPQFAAIHISKNGDIYVQEHNGGIGIFSDFYVSDNNGETFNALISDKSYNAFLITNVADDIFYSDWDKIFMSKDKGQTWTNISSGLPSFPRINHIYIDNDQYIYLSLQNDVLYKSVVPSTQITPTDEAKNENVFSFDIYPNPANVLLKFQMRSDLPVNKGGFRVVDVNGKVIRAIKSVMPKETHIVPVHDWAAGVYFLQYVENSQVLISERFMVGQ